MQLVILTGLSGAGKTHALRRFEDMGYFTMDNLPLDMLDGLIKLCRSKADAGIERAAVVIDSRTSLFEADVPNALSHLTEIDVHYVIIYLDCRDEVLVRRYNETRRRHPLSQDINEGIRLERDMLSPLRESADYVIDTSSLRPDELSSRLEAIFADDIARTFRLTLESFGYKRGVPFEADMVFDMRFSPNPFYEKELRSLSGIDTAVRNYILADAYFVEALDAVEAYLRCLIPRFIAQGKTRLLVAFGCTGGRHRSVCAVSEMHKRLNEDYSIRIVHRDTQIEAEDIVERTGG